ncbi:hypothetical protein NVV43_27960, partial [Escherichia marmotae]|nr:hypothetical protein [Escherichia marmotae]
MTPFRSLAEAVAFWGLLAVSLAIAVAWILRHRKPIGTRRRDLFPLIFVVIAGTIVAGYAEIGPLPHWLYYPGE